MAQAALHKAGRVRAHPGEGTPFPNSHKDSWGLAAILGQNASSTGPPSSILLNRFDPPVLI